jgi:hypothetical protein
MLCHCRGQTCHATIAPYTSELLALSYFSPDAPQTLRTASVTGLVSLFGTFGPRVDFATGASVFGAAIPFVSTSAPAAPVFGERAFCATLRSSNPITLL